MFPATSNDSDYAKYTIVGTHNTKEREMMIRVTG